MLGFSILIYRLALQLYALIIRLSSPFNTKANLWVNGRSAIWDKLNRIDHGNPIIWMHVSSLGEYEQGLPIIKAIQKGYANYQIVLTFFSPSGFEQIAPKKPVDHIFYLPIDSPKNAKRFIDLVKPSVAIFVKYDLWYYYLKALKENGIPSLLISAHFKPDSVYFLWYGVLFRQMLKMLTHIYVQDENSKQLLQSINIDNAIVAGDTRLDRVEVIKREPFENEVIDAFVEGKIVLVAGSTWPKDETILAEWIAGNNNWKLIIAPHEIHTEHIKQIEKQFSKSIVLSKAELNTVNDEQVLIIDSIGILSKLYRYGKVAYIGGGFNSGIHNILEPAVYNIPIMFGPNYHRFLEAEELVKRGGAAVIYSNADVTKVVNHLEMDENYNRASDATQHYCNENIGATNKIMEGISRLLS